MLCAVRRYRLGVERARPTTLLKFRATGQHASLRDLPRSSSLSERAADASGPVVDATTSPRRFDQDEDGKRDPEDSPGQECPVALVITMHTGVDAESGLTTASCARRQRARDARPRMEWPETQSMSTALHGIDKRHEIPARKTMFGYARLSMALASARPHQPCPTGSPLVTQLPPAQRRSGPSSSTVPRHQDLFVYRKVSSADRQNEAREAHAAPRTLHHTRRLMAQGIGASQPERHRNAQKDLKAAPNSNRGSSDHRYRRTLATCARFIIASLDAVQRPAAARHSLRPASSKKEATRPLQATRTPSSLRRPGV